MSGCQCMPCCWTLTFPPSVSHWASWQSTADFRCFDYHSWIIHTSCTFILQDSGIGSSHLREYSFIFSPQLQQLLLEMLFINDLQGLRLSRYLFIHWSFIYRLFTSSVLPFTVTARGGLEFAVDLNFLDCGRKHTGIMCKLHKENTFSLLYQLSCLRHYNRSMIYQVNQFKELELFL